jgi:hypothetical protein
MEAIQTVLPGEAIIFFYCASPAHLAGQSCATVLPWVFDYHPFLLIPHSAIRIPKFQYLPITLTQFFLLSFQWMANFFEYHSCLF